MSIASRLVMRVAAVQFRARKGEPDASLRALEPLAEQAASGSDLVVLPEMATTGYCFRTPDAVRPLAERVDEGPTLRTLAPIAARHRCWIVCGFAERDGERLYNSAMVVAPSGELQLVYRKRLLYELDRLWADPGDTGYPLVDAGATTFTVGICMDLNDERFTSWCADNRPDIVALPTNWVDEGMPVWPYWAHRLRGRTRTLVAANSWGTDSLGLGHQIGFAGASVILRGTTVRASAGRSGDTVIRARLP